MVEGGGGPFVYAQYAPALPSSGHHGLARHCFGRGGPLATLGIMQRELQGTWWGERGQLSWGGDTRPAPSRTGRRSSAKKRSSWKKVCEEGGGWEGVRVEVVVGLACPLLGSWRSDHRLPLNCSMSSWTRWRRRRLCSLGNAIA